jgi:Ser/Thr protein kinase RdoA (MazF antagonist)
MLRPWIDRPVSLQMCLGDIWHDHLLFEGDRLTGLIDFGSVKRDHVAVDLARMLGSMIGDDGKKWQVALTAYQRIRRLSDDEIALVHVLDRSGAILALVNWLTWIYVEKREYEDYQAVAARMEEGIKACRRA